MAQKPIQPDFSTLDLGFATKQYDFPMPSESKSEDARCYISKKLDNAMMNQYLEDQLLQIDEICHVFGKKRKQIAIDRSNNLVESWHEADHACELAKLASEARVLWEETRSFHEAQSLSQLSSCCTSMCSTVAAASSAVVSVSFTAAVSMSSAPDLGSSIFDLCQSAKSRADSACGASGAQLEKRKRVVTSESDAALAAACSLLIHSTSASMPKPGTIADPRSSESYHGFPHRPAATRPPQQLHGVEEFSVGSGWPGH